MGAGVQVFSYMLNLIASGIGFYCCISPHWSENDSENDVIQAIVRNNGLWVKCTTLATGEGYPRMAYTYLNGILTRNMAM